MARRASSALSVLLAASRSKTNYALWLFAVEPPLFNNSVSAVVASCSSCSAGSSFWPRARPPLRPEPGQVKSAAVKHAVASLDGNLAARAPCLRRGSTGGSRAGFGVAGHRRQIVASRPVHLTSPPPKIPANGPVCASPRSHTLGPSSEPGCTISGSTRRAVRRPDGVPRPPDLRPYAHVARHLKKQPVQAIAPVS